MPKEMLASRTRVILGTLTTIQAAYSASGWWGTDISPQKYNASFYVLVNGRSNAQNLTGINISLCSNLTKDVWISKMLPI